MEGYTHLGKFRNSFPRRNPAKTGRPLAQNRIIHSDLKMKQSIFINPKTELRRKSFS